MHDPLSHYKNLIFWCHIESAYKYNLSSVYFSHHITHKTIAFFLFFSLFLPTLYSLLTFTTNNDTNTITADTTLPITTTTKDMEELTRNSLLNIPLKVPADKLEWTPALLEYISTSYAEDAKKYEKDCHTLDKLRMHSLDQSTGAPFALEDLSMYGSLTILFKEQ